MFSSSRFPPIISLALISLLSGCASSLFETSDKVTVSLEDAWLEADQLNKQGVRYFRDGDLALAETQFRRAIKFSEGHGGAHNNLGLLYYRRHQLGKAAVQFEKAVEYMPHHPSPPNNLGMALELAGRLEESIGWYQQAHEMQPTNPLYLGNLLRAKIRAGYDDDLVKAQLRELIMHDNRSSWVNWAEDLLHLGVRSDADTSGQVQLNDLSDDTLNIPRGDAFHIPEPVPPAEILPAPVEGSATPAPDTTFPSIQPRLQPMTIPSGDSKP